MASKSVAVYSCAKERLFASFGLSKSELKLLIGSIFDEKRPVLCVFVSYDLGINMNIGKSLLCKIVYDFCYTSLSKMFDRTKCLSKLSY